MVRELKFLQSQLQLLITEASGEQNMDKNSKKEDKKSTFTKESKAESQPESRVELDSRLLSALLTVSIDLLFLHRLLYIGHCNESCKIAGFCNVIAAHCFRKSCFQ